MKNWKNQIRTSLITVRDQFVNWVDGFTNQFIRSLKGIEGQRDLADIGGFMIDATLRKMLEDLRESYVKMILIFNEMQQQGIQEKLDNIEKTGKAIKDLEVQVEEQDRALNGLVEKIAEAQDKTVSLDALQNKIQYKYMRYFDKKIA